MPARSLDCAGPMPSRVALVHDFLLDLRGAERVFAAICDAWPEADVFTAVYDEAGTEGRFAARRPHTSFLQRVRPTARTFRPLLPLYPHAVESFDLRGYDTVISSSSAWAHGVLVDPGAVHVCYCHNPFRYAWTEREATLRARHPLVRPVLRVLLNRWRQWDWIAAQRVDRYVANSRVTAARVRRYFGREACVLYPPVELGRFHPGPVGEHYMVLAELMAHKRIDIAIEAFNRLRRPLTVVGDGPELRRLKRLAGPTVRFTGRVSDERAAALLASARALVVCATEEFGIAAVEALAAGRPVIALDEGGVRESVREGETGTFFEPCTPEALAAAVARFDPAAADPEMCRHAAEAFGAERFKAELRAVVAAAQLAERAERPGERPPQRGLAGVSGQRARFAAAS
jgi:glycosyltransferase involved in cell wall biosynthesis